MLPEVSNHEPHLVDEKPLISEICPVKGDDWGNVLRTVPPSFDDDTDGPRRRNIFPAQLSHERQLPTSPLNIPFRNLDRAANLYPHGFMSSHDLASRDIPLYKTGEVSTKELSIYSIDLTSSRQRSVLTVFLELWCPERGLCGLEQPLLTFRLILPRIWPTEIIPKIVLRLVHRAHQAGPCTPLEPMEDCQLLSQSRQAHATPIHYQLSADRQSNKRHDFWV